MTIPSANDDPVSPLLDDRVAAQSVLETFWRLQGACRRQGGMARILGLSPLSPESRPWFVGALGEIEVAERLRALSTSGQSWRVLHSVPIGLRSADIDHVVIGPSGVFTITTKNHPDKKVWVGEHEVLVDGQKTPYLCNSRHEAARAAELLGASLGAPVAVRPLIVVVGAASLTVAGQPDGVTVIAASKLVRYLRSQESRLSVDDVRDLTRAALKPRTWQPRSPKPFSERTDESAGSLSVPSPSELHSWFARVRRDVGSARRVRRTWAAGILLVGVAALFTEPTLVQGLLG